MGARPPPAAQHRCRQHVAGRWPLLHLRGPGRPARPQRRHRRLEAAGVVVISAAGNKYPDNQAANAAYPAIVSTLAVGAVYAADVGPQPSIGANSTGPDRLAPFSQRPAPGPGNALFAPGAMVRGLLQGTTQATGSGTSFASPYVAGAVAILQQAAVEISDRGSRRRSGQIMLDTAVIIIDGDDEDDTVENTRLSFPPHQHHRRSRPSTPGTPRLHRRDRRGQARPAHRARDQAKRSNGTGFGPVHRDDAHKSTCSSSPTSERARSASIGPRSAASRPSTSPSPSPRPPASPRGDRGDRRAVRSGVLRHARANIALFTSDADRRRFTMKIAGSASRLPPPRTSTSRAARPPSARRSEGAPRHRHTIRARPDRHAVEHLHDPQSRRLAPGPRDRPVLHRRPQPRRLRRHSPARRRLLDPGKGTTFRVTFTPTARAAQADILIISNDPDETPFVFRIVGAGPDPATGGGGGRAPPCGRRLAGIGRMPEGLMGRITSVAKAVGSNPTPASDSSPGAGDEPTPVPRSRRAGHPSSRTHAKGLTRPRTDTGLVIFSGRSCRWARAPGRT